jgi:hypothetical protein
MAQFKKTQNIALPVEEMAKRTAHSVERSDTNVSPAENNFKIRDATT